METSEFFRLIHETLGPQLQRALMNRENVEHASGVDPQLIKELRDAPREDARRILAAWDDLCDNGPFLLSPHGALAALQVRDTARDIVTQLPTHRGTPSAFIYQFRMKLSEALTALSQSQETQPDRE